MTQKTAEPTGGIVIRWAFFYDLLLKVVTLGREGRFRRRTIEIARLRPGERVLDVGCGTGTLALAAAEAVGRTGSIAGIDPSPEMIARARQKAARSGVDAKLEVGVVESLPHADQTFDVVLSSLMFHHLPDAELRRAGLAQILRVLAPGGRLVLIDFGPPPVDVVEAAGFGAIATGRIWPRMSWLVAETRVAT